MNQQSLVDLSEYLRLNLILCQFITILYKPETFTDQRLVFICSAQNTHHHYQ
jgi:hypothetical protein